MNATLYIAVIASILLACTLVVLYDEYTQNGAALDAARATRIRLSREVADLRGALAAANAHLAEVVAMRDAAWTDLRTARADLRTARADRDRAIAGYQSAADAAATAEVIARKFQIQRSEVLAELIDTREHLAAAQAIAARWERLVGDCSLADLCGIARDRDDK